ncbi:calmodulin [Salix suchowensis]|nr:calmodulin [Salix suchowensis]
MNPSIPQNLDEFSASATTIKFDRPIPLLRGPIPAGPSDDPSISPHVLAFRNPQSWAVAYKTCESKIISQCEEGARFGCAITASNKCKPPWWRSFIGGAKLEDLKERERCEDRELEGCLVAAKDKCVGFAKEKCWKPFREARIAVREEEVVRNLVSLVSVPQRSSKWICLIGSGKFNFGVTNFRASEFLGLIKIMHGFLSRCSGIEEEGEGGLEFWESHGSCCLTEASFVSGRFCGLDWART